LVAVTAGLVLGLAGCGSGDQPSGTATAGGSKAPRKAKSPAQKPDDDIADMVAAVSATKPGPPVELKFALPARPEVGQVVELDVALVPRGPVPDSVSASFQIAEGMEIVDGSQLEHVGKLEDGTPIRHVVKIRPKRDGIFALTAVVSWVQSNQDWSRTFSIPVIAGEGLSEQVAKGP
jgi:hypothetical protein